MTTKTTYKYMITTTLLIIAALLIQSCNKPTEPAKESISVTVEDVSCTEAWLKISDTNANPDITVVVKRDDTDILTLNLNKADTVIVDEKLLPNKSYTYRAVKQQGSNVVEASKPVTAVTLDTTSHNFTWQTFEFGEHGNSVLYDVAIIDENNIWAVGEIYMKDSSGNYDPHAYNAVHWDGQKWELKRIPYTYNGQNFYTSIRAILAFNQNDIWFGIASLIHWNGLIYRSIDTSPFFPALINKMWGSSSKDLYLVGNEGNIAHWNGSSWKKIESGTNVDLISVWGSSDGMSVWTCGHNDDYNSVILRYSGNKLEKIFEGPSSTIINGEPIGFPRGGWTNGRNINYISNNQYLYELKGNSIEELQKKTPYYGELIFTIYVKNSNDIFVSGQHGLVGHYNGINYHQIEGLKKQKKNLYSISAGEKVIVAVGVQIEGIYGWKAVLHMIRR